MAPDHRIAVCPGSYDPITNGHLDVIARASELFDEVIVGVVNLPARKGKTLFGVEERLSFIAEATAHLDGVRAERFSTLVVDFAREHGAKAIVKGLRAISDFMASPQYSFLSSSGIKELAMFGGAIEELVPERVAKRLKEELGR
jgi:pantetheine-phosphate adenylyltransferase